MPSERSIAPEACKKPFVKRASPLLWTISGCESLAGAFFTLFQQSEVLAANRLLTVPAARS
eukprot:6200411-Pleurochrysis_carterae.AAC.2